MRNRFKIVLFLLVGSLSGCGGGSGDNATGIGATVAVYSFDETTGSSARNSASDKFQGVIYGASRVSGKVGNALQFGAPAARVEVYTFYGDGQHMSFPNDTISIGAWIKADSMPSGTVSHIVGNGPGGTETFRLQLNSDKVEFLLNDGQHYSTIITSTQHLAPGTWYHLMLTYDGTTAKLYINGSLDASVVISFHLNPVWNTMYVGANSEQVGTYSFHGLIDELRFYNSVIPQTEIQAYYDSTK
jgi:hypothetical protein